MGKICPGKSLVLCASVGVTCFFRSRIEMEYNGVRLRIYRSKQKLQHLIGEATTLVKLAKENILTLCGIVTLWILCQNSFKKPTPLLMRLLENMLFGDCRMKAQGMKGY